MLFHIHCSFYRRFTNYYVPSCLLTCKNHILSSTVISHFNSCMRDFSSSSRWHVGCFLWNFTHSVLCLCYLALSTLYCVSWIFVVKLHSRWLADSETLYSTACSNFTCWKLTKYLCNRFNFPKMAARITPGPHPLMRCTVVHPSAGGRGLSLPSWIGQHSDYFTR